MGGDTQAAPPLDSATPFEAHVLSLLAALHHNPSLSFQTPAVSGPQTPAQKAIQQAILSLGQRAASASSSGQQPLVTPTRTPPPPPVAEDNSALPYACPECSAPLRRNVTPTSTFATLELNSPRAPHQASWNSGGVGESGMSAEKELELLKAQVQDIARVCKVGRHCACFNLTPGRRDWRPYAKDCRARQGPGYDGTQGYYQLYGRQAQDIRYRSGTCLA